MKLVALFLLILTIAFAEGDGPIRSCRGDGKSVIVASLEGAGAQVSSPDVSGLASSILNANRLASTRTKANDLFLSYGAILSDFSVNDGEGRLCHQQSATSIACIYENAIKGNQAFKLRLSDQRLFQNGNGCVETSVFSRSLVSIGSTPYVLGGSTFLFTGDGLIAGTYRLKEDGNNGETAYIEFADSVPGKMSFEKDFSGAFLQEAIDVKVITSTNQIVHGKGSISTQLSGSDFEIESAVLSLVLNQ